MSIFMCKIYCDKHVVKMILETAQMLSVTHWLCSNCPHKNLYKQTKAFANHPVNGFVNLGNYKWIYIV